MPRSINIEEGTASKRAARPSLELYRPGMLKRVGTLPEHNRDMNTTVTERKAERGISVECVASSSNDKRSNTSQVHEVQHSSKFRRYDFHTNENKWMESDRNYRGGSSHRARQDAQRGRSRHYSIMNEPERYPQTSRRRSSIPNDYGHQNNPHESIQRDGHVSLHNSSQASIGECRMSRNENDSKNNTNDRSVQTGRGGLASRQLPETSITLEKCDPLNELCNLMGNSLDFNAAYEEHEQLMTKETETRMMESAVKISVCSDTSNIRRDCGHSGKHNYSRPRSRASRDNRPNHWHFRNQGNNRFHRVFLGNEK